ncbi:alpha/beta hydrolase family protein [Rhizobium halophytocola]|uniref:Alpha/beta hydrolase n=1 Tax=Rhizobium halophytocola TaxID=735519 RepID=A0ABS4DZ67_9HYPH|nr:alpha/beta fold hydrolase [Rhizobium halophytocola]MBP1850970.1 putative alpha/beta hydrolase [Rhizobium halophytocola]
MATEDRAQSVPDGACLTRPITFAALDDHPLAGTLFTGTGDGPLALISSAAAVAQRFYRRFAEYLVTERSFRAALTYDYRGVAASRTPRDWTQSVMMLDWAEKDFPAALARLEQEAPERPVVGVSQSFGGQALGLGQRHDHFQRYMMVAAMTGHWANLEQPLKIFATMNLVGVPIAMVTGRLPGWVGLGEALPGTVFRQWARWGRRKEYFFADPSLRAEQRFAEVRTPILAIGATDDPWGTPRAEEALLKYYSNAPLERRRFTPQEAGGPIGHLGFFRKEYRDRLWAPAADWLLKGS